MVGKEIIREVSHDGTLKLKIPEYSGRKVKILCFPVGEDRDEERLDFLAATYLSAIEDDEEEDAIWEKHIK